ncbi:hypothetical protein [Roseovarius sp. M141]|uniref:hypothetical protein n=1 Tax=Roseovarius sp. M141 TaxID=2583806 RepID=UPI0020CC95E4|nr:hypothetical protein [Roseovarius sp. M141]MCQ0091056.1 hypothetical protein [Roseovarius sp. M141]
MRTLVLACCMIAAPASAEDRLTAEQFDAYTRGQTFVYGSMGTPYGAEQYMEGRRVRWSFLDGRCLEGEWYERGDLICFVYDLEPDPQCWSFRHGTDGLIAQFANDLALDELYEVERSAQPLSCPGPDVGV